jgi:hypothetical protein
MEAPEESQVVADWAATTQKQEVAEGAHPPRPPLPHLIRAASLALRAPSRGWGRARWEAAHRLEKVFQSWLDLEISFSGSSGQAGHPVLAGMRRGPCSSWLGGEEVGGEELEGVGAPLTSSLQTTLQLTRGLFIFSCPSLCTAVYVTEQICGFSLLH